MVADGDDVTVGLDIGTTAVKAVAVDGSGFVRARVRVPNHVFTAEPGAFEHNAAAAWQRAPLLALAGLDAPGRGCAALGVAACVPSLVAIDADLTPLSPGLLYGDARGRTEAAAAVPPAGPMDVREGAAFLDWAARRWPHARGYWPAQAVAMAALGAEPVIDLFSAMAFFPVFNGIGWNPELLAEMRISEEQLPRVNVNVGAPVGSLATGGPAGLTRRATLAAGGVDAVAEQVTVGASSVGDVHILCGTTLVTWAVVADNGDVPGLWRIPHQRPGLCMIGGPSNAGGLFLDWARKLSGVRSADRAPRNLAHPDRVPLWVPYVRGERTPLHDHSLRASLHDLDISHDQAALRRAAYEATGFVVRRQLELAGCKPSRIVATGGGVRDPMWMQAIADCTGTVVVCSLPEGAALGMAWLARMAAGLESSLAGASRWFRAQRLVYPDERWHVACDRRYARFRALADRGRPGLPGLPG